MNGPEETPVPEMVFHLCGTCGQTFPKAVGDEDTRCPNCNREEYGY